MELFNFLKLDIMLLLVTFLVFVLLHQFLCDLLQLVTCFHRDLCQQITPNMGMIKALGRRMCKETMIGCRVWVWWCWLRVELWNSTKFISDKSMYWLLSSKNTWTSQVILSHSSVKKMVCLIFMFLSASATSVFFIFIRCIFDMSNWGLGPRAILTPNHICRPLPTPWLACGRVSNACRQCGFRS